MKVQKGYRVYAWRQPSGDQARLLPGGMKQVRFVLDGHFFNCPKSADVPSGQV
jgi:hypothetical protein